MTTSTVAAAAAATIPITISVAAVLRLVFARAGAASAKLRTTIRTPRQRDFRVKLSSTRHSQAQLLDNARVREGLIYHYCRLRCLMNQNDYQNHGGSSRSQSSGHFLSS